MAEIDSVAEWRRLQQTYSEMPDEDLETMAGQGYELTDIARQALTSEISRRGLKVVVRMFPPEPDDPESQIEVEDPAGHDGFDPANLDLRKVSFVETRAEAEWVKQTLNEAGVPCFFGNDPLHLTDDLNRLDFVRNIGFGVGVLYHDIDRARMLLRHFDDVFQKPPEEEPPDFEIHCPKCMSSEVVLKKFVRSRTDVPSANHWTCDECGHEWQDDGGETR
jgi:DNA-directed RNA polymerase subunit M/transcription elongation factor TFIIS